MVKLGKNPTPHRLQRQKMCFFQTESTPTRPTAHSEKGNRAFYTEKARFSKKHFDYNNKKQEPFRTAPAVNSRLYPITQIFLNVNVVISFALRPS